MIRSRASILMVILPIFLAGCDQRAGILEQEYQSAEKYGLKDDMCRSARKIADIYLERSDAANYQRWSLTRDIDCMATNTKMPA